MARPVTPGFPSLATSEDKSLTPSDDSLPAYSTLAKGEESCLRLHFHMDNSVWDVIHNEMMDWRDPNWTSMNLPGNKTCEHIVFEPCCYNHQSHADSSVCSPDSSSSFLAGSGTTKAVE